MGFADHEAKSWALQNIFACRITFDFLSNMAHIVGKTPCSCPRRRPGRQAHGSTGLAPSAPCAVPIRLVQNNERYLAFSLAIPRAFLEASDLRAQILTIHL